jgi:hypothetical protein
MQQEDQHIHHESVAFGAWAEHKVGLSSRLPRKLSAQSKRFGSQTVLQYIKEAGGRSVTWHHDSWHCLALKSPWDLHKVAIKKKSCARGTRRLFRREKRTLKPPFRPLCKCACSLWCCAICVMQIHIQLPTLRVFTPSNGLINWDWKGYTSMKFCNASYEYTLAKYFYCVLVA